MMRVPHLMHGGGDSSEDPRLEAGSRLAPSEAPRRRGIGGKGGKTAGRGNKGQGARGHGAGRGSKAARRRCTAARRRPRGSRTRSAIEYHVVNLDDARDVRRQHRGHPGHAARAAASSPSGAWSRCWPGARSPSPSRSTRTGSRPRRSRRSRPRAAPPRCFRCRGRPASPGPRERPHQPVGTLPIPVDRRSSPPCQGSRACGTCSGSLTCGTRSSSRSSSSSSSGSGRTSPCRTSTSSAIQELKNAAENERRRRSASSTCSPAARSRAVAVFFLGIMPYITASIIMQLLGVVIPKLEQWQQRGPDRAEEDHAVDALPHGRAGADAVDRVRVRAEERQRRAARPVGLHAARRASC